MKIFNKATIMAIIYLFALSSTYAQNEKLLIFTKTKGFRHQSIEKGKEVLTKLLGEKGYAIDTTGKADAFTDENLKRYEALIFLNTTGDLFNDQQQDALVRYMNNGGGYVGIHAATDAEYEWPWYGKMIGGYFKSHPRQQNAIVRVTAKDHPATNMLPDEWTRWDEWYDFKDLNPNIIVLARLDETSYEGGGMNYNHPIVWYHEYEGGRVFYTGFGHTDETFEEPLFQQHILGGIQYVIEK